MGVVMVMVMVMVNSQTCHQEERPVSYTFHLEAHDLNRLLDSAALVGWFGSWYARLEQSKFNARCVCSHRV